MVERTEITCDGCGRDLTYTGNCEAYRLALSNERIRSRGSIVTSMAAYPAIERTAHFCKLSCLRKWLDEKSPS